MASSFGKYFTKEEFVCKCGCGGCDISQKLVDKLNTVRELSKERMTINSGFRCLSHNKAIGSSDTSSHCKGLAVDIQADNSAYRYKLLRILYFLGFERIGIHDKFIHVDIDENKPQNITYLY